RFECWSHTLSMTAGSDRQRRPENGRWKPATGPGPRSACRTMAGLVVAGLSSFQKVTLARRAGNPHPGNIGCCEALRQSSVVDKRVHLLGKPGSVSVDASWISCGDFISERPKPLMRWRFGFHRLWITNALLWGTAFDADGRPPGATAGDAHAS